MRLLSVFALVFVGLAFVQGHPIVPQSNSLSSAIQLLPQFQEFLGQLDEILPQLTGVLSSSELQPLKEKIIEVILRQPEGNLDLNTIKDKLRPVLQQFFDSKSSGRIDFDAICQEIADAAASSLPNIVLSILGKRQATYNLADLGDLSALGGVLANFPELSDILSSVGGKLLNAFIPQIEQYLTPDELKQLQSQVFATVVTSLSNKWDSDTLAKALEQVVSQSVPQVAEMNIDWEAFGESTLNYMLETLISILSMYPDMPSKRDVGVKYQHLLSKLPADKLVQISYQGRVNFDELCSNLLTDLDILLPTLGNSVYPSVSN